MLSRVWTKSMLVVSALLAAAGSAGAQAQDPCLARLPGDLVTLNLREANTQTTLRLLAQQYRVNMVVTDEVKGTVTLDFFKVPLRDVFSSILDALGLRCTVQGEVLRVSSIARLRTEEEDRRKIIEAQRKLEVEIRSKELENRRREDDLQELAARGPVREETIRLRYADAEEVARTVQGILGLRATGTSFNTPVPLPQVSQLLSPSPPVQIPSSPLPPQTVALPEAPMSPEAVARGLTVGAYRPTNSVFIRYYARDLERIKQLIEEKLDVPLPQIQIAAQMVITTLNALEQIGVQWGAGGAGGTNAGVLVGQGFSTSPNSGGTPISTTPPPATVGNLVNLPTSFLPTIVGANPAGGLLLGLIGSNFNVNLAIQALEVKGKARTLAAPKTVTVENAKATISRGFEVPFTSTPSQGVSQVQFKDALMNLEVTPRLIRDGADTRIRMKVVFDNDAPDFTNSVQGNPSIFKRHQETEVVVREGQKLVIGGVTNDQTATQTRQIPLMGDIPALGWLFRSRENNISGEELIVIITPTVLPFGSPVKR